MMAAQIADRLAAQEEEIRRLNEEIGVLLELGLSGTVSCEASPALEELRAENQKLKYRVGHLQRSLREEQGRGSPEADSGALQGPSGPEVDNGEPEKHPDEDKKENSAGERTSGHPNKKKKEKKSVSEVNGLKPEGTLPCGNGYGPDNCYLRPLGSLLSSCQGPLPDLLQLVHKREYRDTFRRPWKVIFPHDDMLKEPAGSMILLRVDEPAPSDQATNSSDHRLPRWLEQQESLRYTSPSSTWKVLFTDPSQDSYLLLLKKDLSQTDCYKKATHSLSCHTLK